MYSATLGAPGGVEIDDLTPDLSQVERYPIHWAGGNVGVRRRRALAPGPRLAAGLAMPGGHLALRHSGRRTISECIAARSVGRAAR
jgi:hypothetical protein